MVNAKQPKCLGARLDLIPTKCPWVSEQHNQPMYTNWKTKAYLFQPSLHYNANKKKEPAFSRLIFEGNQGYILLFRNFASSETQGQIVGTRESLNGRKNMARRKVKNSEKRGPSSKRSSPFWLLIGARKLLCFSAQSEASRPMGRFVYPYTE